MTHAFSGEPRGDSSTQSARIAVAGHLERAELFAELGRWDDFHVSLREARRAEPLGPASLVRADWLSRRSRIDEAVVELEAVLAIGRLNCEPSLFVAAAERLAGILQRAGRHDEADRVLQRTIRVAEEHDLYGASLFTALGVAAMNRGELQVAERLLHTAYGIAEAEGDVADALARLGELHLAAGRSRDALSCLWRAYRLHVRVGDEIAIGRDLLQLGNLCWTEGRTRIAFRAWRKGVVRFEKQGAVDWADRIWARIDMASRVIEVRNRNPELN